MRRARANVDRWERDGLCSDQYIFRWRARLKGSAWRAAAALLRRDKWSDALLQSSPWSFALGPKATSRRKRPRLGEAIRRALAEAPEGLGIERRQPRAN